MTAEVLGRLLGFAAVLAVLWAAETRWPARPIPAGRWRVAAANWALGLTNTAMLRLALPWLAWDVARWAQGAGVGLLPALGLGGTLLAAVIGFLALDLGVYLQHRASHRWPWLWRLHAVHHAEGHLDVSSAVRFHPLEILLSMLWKIVLVASLGIPAAAVIGFELVLAGTSLWNHANIRLPEAVDRPLSRWIVTPNLHREHHLLRDDRRHPNYGFSLSVWDRLLRSFRPASGRTPGGTIGLAQAVGADASWLGLLALPFRRP